MFGIGGSEIIVILIVALIFLGPEKMPEMTKKISRGIRDLKKGSQTLQRTIENDRHIGGALRDIKSALRGEDEPPPLRKKKRPKRKPAVDPALQAVGGEIENKIATDGKDEPAVEAAADTAAEAVDALPAPKPTVKLPPLAGESDDGKAASAIDHDHDNEELAAMVRPASGTVARKSDVS